MRTLRSSSRFTPAYDPLESEADRLLAQTCARLGVRDESQLEVVKYEDAEYSGPQDEIVALRRDLQKHLQEIGKIEESDLSAKAASYAEYRCLEANTLVCKGLGLIVRHMEMSVKPHIELDRLWGIIDHAAASLREELEAFRDAHQIKDIDRSERDDRHREIRERIQRKQEYDKPRHAIDYTHSEDRQSDGYDERRASDESKQVFDALMDAHVMNSRTRHADRYEIPANKSGGRPLLPMPKRGDARREENMRGPDETDKGRDET